MEASTYLLITPHETDDHRLFLSPLHAVDSPDLQLGSVYRSKERR